MGIVLCLCIAFKVRIRSEVLVQYSDYGSALNGVFTADHEKDSGIPRGAYIISALILASLGRV